MLRQLWEAVQKRTSSLHVFICNKLMMPVWGRLLFNMASFMVYGPLGESFWLSSMHKLFVLGFILPLIPHMPCWIRGITKVKGMGRMASLMIQESPGDEGIVMHQIRLIPKRVASMSGVL